MKLLKLLTIIILIIFPFGELLRFDIGDNIVIKPLDFLTGLTVAWWSILKTQNLKLKTLRLRRISLWLKHYSSKFKVFLTFFVLTGLLSLLLNLTWLKIDDFFVSLLYLIRWGAYALIFFVIIQFDKKFKKKIKFLLFIDGFLILFFGYLQYFFYNSLKNQYYLGWDEHMHRIFSIFFDPNYASAFFVLYLIFTAGFFVANLKKVNKKIIVGNGFLILLTLVAIFLTFSRSGILMLIAGGITFILLINKKKLIFVLLLALLLFGIITSPKFYDENMNLFRFNSTEARIANDLIALKVFQDHPFVGVGFNSYRYTKRLYDLPHDWVRAPSHADAGVDNSFLFVLATAGIVGFFAYIGMWFFLLKKAYLRYKKENNILAIIFISSSIGLFVDALFINSLFFAPIMLWMWVLSGLMWDS